MKRTYEKLKPRIVNYRDYKNFCNDTFRQILLEKLAAENINTNYNDFEKVLQICINTLDIFTEIKLQYFAGYPISIIRYKQSEKSLKCKKFIVTLFQ